MTKTTKLRRIGNSYGVILGKDLAEEPGIEPGDELHIVRTDDGIRLTPFDPEFAEAMEAGVDYMNRHRNALRELAA